MLFLFIVGAAFLGWFYLIAFHKNVATKEKNPVTLLVPKGSDFNRLMDSLTKNGYLKYRKPFYGQPAMKIYRKTFVAVVTCFIGE